ncbi:MAG: hypothetical protein M1827_000948 [Pycnora praestabilis]|nr:MAG: hypothetical protein M1827_000948 [Pycnora praestabilis]
MSSLAQELRQDSNCGTDYGYQNPVVQQAYNGLVAYEPLYRAGCLKDFSGSYCFADAITNTSSPSDSYTYYLPLGVSLPGASSPTCNTCLQNTMAVFDEAAANKSQPVSAVYAAAAQQMDIKCGPTYINATVPKATGAAVNYRPNPATFGLVLALTLMCISII